MNKLREIINRICFALNSMQNLGALLRLSGALLGISGANSPRAPVYFFPEWVKGETMCHNTHKTVPAGTQLVQVSAGK